MENKDCIYILALFLTLAAGLHMGITIERNSHTAYSRATGKATK